MWKRIAVSVLLLNFVLSAQCLFENDFPEVDIPGIFVPDPDDLDDVTTEQPNPRVCLPSSWQGNVSSQVGVAGGKKGPIFIHSSSSMFIVNQPNGSSPQQKLAGRRRIGRYHNETGGFIMVFNTTANTSLLYLFNLNANACCAMNFTHSRLRPQCLPENATKEGTFSLGQSSGGLQVTSYLIRGRPHPRDEGEKRRKVTGVVGARVLLDSKSLPVIIQDHGAFRRGGSQPEADTNVISMDQYDDDDDNEDKRKPKPPKSRGIAFIGGAFFSNTKSPVSDTNVFNPPASCRNAKACRKQDEEDFDLSVPDVVDRFATY